MSAADAPAGFRSPGLDLPGAVPAQGPDAGVAGHYGDPFREQRSLASGEAVVDLGHLGVVRVTGPDRRRLLHALSTQDVAALAEGGSTELAVLSPHGHVEHAAAAHDDGTSVTLVTDAGRAPALAAFLDSMAFLLDVETTDVTPGSAVLWRAGSAGGPLLGGATVVATPRGRFEVVPRDRVAELLAGTQMAGVEAYEALRVAAGEARLDTDVDHRTIPNELGWIGTAVALDKGCYRGQETVARVHTLGRPPRRLTVLQLDGSEDVLPGRGDEVRLGDRVVGTVGSAARHFETGPIALSLLKRSVPVEAVLTVRAGSALAAGSPPDGGGAGDGGVGSGGTVRVTDVPATQEPVVDPEVGLHARPRLG